MSDTLLVHRDRCDILNGSATVTQLKLNGTAINGASLTSDYDYVWKDASSATLAPVGPGTGAILDVGTYTVVATKKSSLSQTASTPGSGCSTPRFTVVIKDLRAYPEISLSPVENTACDTNFNGSITVTAITSTGPGVGSGYNFVWTNDPDGLAGNVYSASNSSTANTFSPFTTLSMDKIGGGTYAIRVTNAATQCFSDASVKVLDDTPVVEILTTSKTDQMICNPDGSIQVQTLSLGVPTDYTYVWYLSSPSSTPLVDATSAQITGSSLQTGVGAGQYPTMGAGTYFVTAQKLPGNNPGSGCITAPFKVDILDVHTDPTIAAETLNADLNCSGSVTGTGKITINEANPMSYTYNWFTGDDVTGSPVLSTGGTNGEVLLNLQKGDYTVRVKENATNCTSVRSYTIDNSPTIVAFDPSGFSSPAVTTCNLATGVPSNGTATITSILENNLSQPVPGNYIFTWTDASNTVLQSNNSTTLSNLSPGNYFVTALNSVSNCSTNYAFTVDDQTIGSTTVSLIDFGNVERCVNPKTGFLTAQGGGNGASYSYEWYSGDQRPSPAGVPIANTSLLNGITIPSGQTQVTFTVKAINNTNNCWAVDAYAVPLITNTIIVSASSSPLTYCTSNNGEVFASIVNDNKFDYNFYWGIGNTVNPATPDYTTDDVQNIPDGNYTVVAIDILDNTCVSQPVTVVVDKNQATPAVTTALLKALTFCDPTKPNGQAAASVGGDVQHYSFDWYQGTTATGSIIHTGSEIDSLTNTDYTVNATDLVTGCVGTATINIPNQPETVLDPTVLVLSDQTSCLTWSDGRPRYNGSLSASVSGVTKDYIFDWADGSNPPPPIDHSGELYDSLNVGKYTVIATNRISGCKSNPVTAPIIENKKFPDIDFLVQSATCNNANGFITLLVSNDISLERVAWYHDGAQVDDGPNLQDAMAGQYTVKVVTTLGCETDKDVVLPADILAYNGISRNGDGNNDFFLIECIENFPSNHVEIFNRAGTKVYEADGYDNSNVLFDGNSNRGISIMGTHLPSGTYFFVISKGDGSKSIVGYLELVD